jgi:hypothetical protein
MAAQIAVAMTRIFIGLLLPPEDDTYRTREKYQDARKDVYQAT